MKLRESINNGADEFSASVFEDRNTIVVIKMVNSNHFDCSTDEKFIFKTIAEYEVWKKNQNWINPKKVKKISSFKKVA